MSENEIVQVLLFGHKSFSKDMDFKIFTSSIHFIKDSKIFDESLSSWEKHFWYIYTGIKNWKYFFTFYLLWRAVRYRFCVCIVLYISFFKFSVVCRCVCYDVDKGNDKMCKQWNPCLICWWNFPTLLKPLFFFSFLSLISFFQFWVFLKSLLLIFFYSLWIIMVFPFHSRNLSPIFDRISNSISCM